MIRIPVYKDSWNYALEHAERDLYIASDEANMACKAAVEKAVSDHYNDGSLNAKAAVEEVVGKFGLDRLVYVLALTVRNKEWDVRISTDNKQWARGILIFESEEQWDEKRQCVVDKCSSGLLNIFITAARQDAFRTGHEKGGTFV